MGSASELWGPSGRCDGKGHGGSVATGGQPLGSLFWCLDCDLIPVDGWPVRERGWARTHQEPADQPPADG